MGVGRLTQALLAVAAGCLAVAVTAAVLAAAYHGDAVRDRKTVADRQVARIITRAAPTPVSTAPALTQVTRSWRAGPIRATVTVLVARDISTAQVTGRITGAARGAPPHASFSLQGLDCTAETAPVLIVGHADLAGRLRVSVSFSSAAGDFWLLMFGPFELAGRPGLGQLREVRDAGCPG